MSFAQLSVSCLLYFLCLFDCLIDFFSTPCDSRFPEFLYRFWFLDSCLWILCLHCSIYYKFRSYFVFCSCLPLCPAIGSHLAIKLYQNMTERCPGGGCTCPSCCSQACGNISLLKAMMIDSSVPQPAE